MSNLDTLLLSAEQLERYRALLAEQGVPDAGESMFPVRAPGQPIPLCSYQEPLWFIDRYAGGDTAHNVVYPMGLPEGDLDERVLVRAIERMIERHEILRSTFRQEEDRVVQVVHDGFHVELHRVDLCELPENRREQAGWGLVDSEAEHQFDLEAGPLIRFTLLIAAPGKNVLMVSLHHIVCDTWSVAIIDREVRTHYDDIMRGQTCSLPAIERQFGDYAVWQRKLVDDGVYARAVDYWVDRLKDAPQLQLPEDFPAPKQRTHKASNCLVYIKPELLVRIKAYAKAEGVTLYMMLLTAFKIMLARHTGQEDIVVGTPHSNRDLDVMRDVIGFTINSLVLRSELGGNPSFAETVRRVRATALEAYEHHAAPFQSIVEALHARGGRHEFSRYSFFRCFFSVQNIQWADTGLPQINTGSLHDRPRFTVPHPTTKYDMYMYLRERDGKVLGGVEYDSELFSHARIERMVSHFLRILEEGVAAPDTPIAHLAILSDEEVRQQTIDWNADIREPAPVGDIYEAFEAVASKHADSVAIVDDGQALTYGELAAAVSRRAALFGSLGPEERVGLLADRSSELVVTMLAILRQGGACVLLDHASPAARINDMVAIHGIHTLVRDPRVGLDDVVARICLDLRAAAPTETAPARQAVVGGQTAFVFMTSGSTGVPNAVEVPHAAVLHGQLQPTCKHPIGPGDRFLLTAPTSSARLVGELLWPLLNGATVVLARAAGHQDASYLGHMLRDQRITVFGTLPQMLETLLQDGSVGSSPSLRLVYCVGQNLRGELVSRFVRNHRAELVNTYAQTEACPVAFHACTGTTDDDVVPVGSPAPNTSVFILDPYLHLSPAGVSGEIAVAGPCLARGYAGNPRLTADKFVPNPFGAPGSRMYRSGDIGSWDASGKLKLLGRGDDRVKIRGYRIDLREIVEAMLAVPQVEEAVVLPTQSADGSPSIAGFFSVRAGQRAIDTLDRRHEEPQQSSTQRMQPNVSVADQVRAALQARLPFYMMPSRLLELNAIPRGRTGKVDRQALLASLDAPAEAPRKDSVRNDAPTTDLQRTLVEIWRSVLDIPADSPVGIYDSFFELGGHSLTAVAIVKRIQRQIGVKLELRNVFEAVTIAGLCDLIEWSTATQALEDIEL